MLGGISKQNMGAYPSGEGIRLISVNARGSIPLAPTYEMKRIWIISSFGQSTWLITRRCGDRSPDDPF